VSGCVRDDGCRLVSMIWKRWVSGCFLSCHHPWMGELETPVLW
jgi:hypothetical protein